MLLTTSLLLSLVPTVVIVVSLVQNYSHKLGGDLCDCWIALLLSTAFSIAIRMVISWRFVDLQLETRCDTSSLKKNSRGSVLDLIVALSAFAIIFALIQYRWEGPFRGGTPHVMLQVMMALLSTFATVAFIRLFAPLALLVQVIFCLLALPLAVGISWLSLQLTDSIIGFDLDSELVKLAIAISSSAALFAWLTSACQLRLHGFQQHKLGSRAVRLISFKFCVLGFGLVLVWLNKFVPYGTKACDSFSSLGWPFAHSHLVVRNPNSFLPYTNEVLDFRGLWLDTLVGVPAVLVLGYGTASIACNILFRNSDADLRTRSPWCRSSIWLAAIPVTFAFLASFSYFNVRTLIVDAEFDQRPHANDLFVQRVAYEIHPADRLAKWVCASLGYSVPDQMIVDVDTIGVTDIDEIREICRLPELRTLSIPAELEELPIECIDSLVMRNRLLRLWVGNTPISARSLERITQIDTLESLSLLSPIPGTAIKFGDQIRDLHLDLRQSSEIVGFPRELRNLELEISDQTKLQGFSQTMSIDSLVLECSDRTLSIDLDSTKVEQLVLHHGDNDLSLTLPSDSYRFTLRAVRSPKLPVSGGREPRISVQVGADRYEERAQMSFLNSSCRIINTGAAFKLHAVLHLKNTKTDSLLDQLVALPNDLEYTLHMHGDLDAQALQQLSRLKMLHWLEINTPISTRNEIPFEALPANAFPKLEILKIHNAPITQIQFDSLLRASPALSYLVFDASQVKSVSLGEHPNIQVFGAMNSSGLIELELPEKLPQYFIVTRKTVMEDMQDAEYCISGKAFGRSVVHQILSDSKAKSICVESKILPGNVWKDADFDGLEVLELESFPSVELFRTWRFGEDFRKLIVGQSGEVPLDLMVAVFQNPRSEFLADFGVYQGGQRSWIEPSAHALSLENRKVTAKLIAALTTIKTLRTLDLSGADVTVEQIAEIKRLCPWLDSVYSDLPIQ